MQKNMENLQVSVIIIHHYGDLIFRCLKSLENIQAEKIVVTSDLNFKKPTPDIRCLYVPMHNFPTFKRNQGSILAHGELLCFMDDDVEIQENCLQNMATYLVTNPDVGMVYGLLYKMDNHNIVDTSGSFLTWVGFLNETYEDRDWAIPILSGKSALCMVRQDIFREVGKFDEDFVIYGEETDLSWRIWLAGYKIMVLPSAIGYHAFETPLKPRSYYNQRYIHYHGCKNYLTMLIKCLPANRLYIVGINAFIWFIMGCVLWPRNRQGAGWIWQGIWYNIRNFRYIWGKRKKIKRIKSDYWHLIYKNPRLSYYFGRFKDYISHQLHG